MWSSCPAVFLICQRPVENTLQSHKNDKVGQWSVSVWLFSTRGGGYVQRPCLALTEPWKKTRIQLGKVFCETGHTSVIQPHHHGESRPPRTLICLLRADGEQPPKWLPVDSELLGSALCAEWSCLLETWQFSGYGLLNKEKCIPVFNIRGMSVLKWNSIVHSIVSGLPALNSSFVKLRLSCGSGLLKAWNYHMSFCELMYTMGKV